MPLLARMEGLGIAIDRKALEEQVWCAGHASPHSSVLICQGSTMVVGCLVQLRSASLVALPVPHFMLAKSRTRI